MNVSYDIIMLSKLVLLKGKVISPETLHVEPCTGLSQCVYPHTLKSNSKYQSTSTTQTVQNEDNTNHYRWSFKVVRNKKCENFDH